LASRQRFASTVVILIWLCCTLLACGGEVVDLQEVPPTATYSVAVVRVGPDCTENNAALPWVTDLGVYPVPNLARPASRQWFVDPTFGRCLVRVTDSPYDLAAGDGSTGMVNEYSRVQAFNADGSRLLARSTGGGWYLYDADTLLPLGELPLGSEPRWDAEDPARIYYLDELRLMSYHILSGESGLVHDFGGHFPGQDVAAVWTRYEGRPSRNSRFWGLMAEDEEWLPVAFVVYDRQVDAVTIRDMRGVPGMEDDVDHVTISPLGTFFLVSFDRACEDGQLGSEARPCGLMVYDRDLTNGRGLLRIIGHYDAALDAQGREVIAYQDIDSDQIAMLGLESGVVTPLWDIDFSHTELGFHFSGLAYDRPGWVVVSTHDDARGSHTWMDDQVFVIELKAGGRVVRLAHTHSVVNDDEELDYWAEPHASTNPDLTRIVFGSNWGRSGTGEVEMYMIELPSDWTERLAVP
jgi:hypothetical protein